jgi:hypothetical protein
MDRDGDKRIRKPLLYPTELRDQTREFPRYAGLLKIARFRSRNIAGKAYISAGTTLF